MCSCGNFTLGNNHVSELIIDNLIEADLVTTPIFADPLTLSFPLSIAVTIIVGKIMSVLATAVYLPPIIGFLVGGILIQDILSPELLKGCGGNGPHNIPRSEFSVVALVIILMRAGLSLSIKVRKARFPDGCFTNANVSAL